MPTQEELEELVAERFGWPRSKAAKVVAIMFPNGGRVMPRVGGKHYPYTAAGKKAASKARKKGKKKKK